MAAELKLEDIKDLLKTELAAEREHMAAMFAAERKHMDGRFDEILTATAEVVSSVNDHMDERFDEVLAATAETILAVNDNVDKGFDRIERIVGVHSKDITELRSHLA